MKHALLTIIFLLCCKTCIGATTIGQGACTQYPAPDVLTYGLVGYWKFDEGTGTTALDSSGMGNHGTITGATWIDGIRGKCLSFDGVDDYVVGYFSQFTNNTQPITMSMWVNIPESFSWINGNFIYLGATYYGIGIYRNIATDTVSYVSRIGNANPYSLQNKVVSRDVWYHMCLVGNGSTFNAYLNGVKLNSGLLYYGIYDGSSVNGYIRLATTAIYGSSGGGFFKGLIDEVRIYNRALDSAEIQTLYYLKQ